MDTTAHPTGHARLTDAAAPPARIVVEATVRRVDGTVEHLGVVATSDDANQQPEEASHERAGQ